MNILSIYVILCNRSTVLLVFPQFRPNNSVWLSYSFLCETRQAIALEMRCSPWSVWSLFSVSWSLETKNKLHAIEPTVNITKSYRLPRRDEIIIHRLRIGHTFLTRWTAIIRTVIIRTVIIRTPDRQNGRVRLSREGLSRVERAGLTFIIRTVIINPDCGGTKAWRRAIKFCGGAGADCYTASELGGGAAFCLAHYGKVTAAQGSILDHTLLP